VLALFSLLLFLVSFTLYVTEFPLRYYLFGLPAEGTSKVGRVKVYRGDLRRQLVGESEFLKAEGGTVIYADDTVVTGADGSAILEIDGYGEISLGPDTMVKLSFENRLSLGGIERAPSIQVVTGDVTGLSKQKPIELRPKTGKVVRIVPKSAPERIKITDKEVVVAPNPLALPSPKASPQAAPKVAEEELPIPELELPPPPIVVAKPKPSPSPSPTVVAEQVIELVSPTQDQVLMIDPDPERYQKKVNFFWRMPGYQKPVNISLWKLGGKEGRKLELKSTVELENGVGRRNWTLKQPGKYEWDVRDDADGVISPKQKWYAQFSLKDEVTGIKVKDALVNGQKMDTNAFNGKAKDFAINLEWAPVPDADEYVLQIFRDEKANKAILQKTVKEPRYVLNKNRVYNGRIYWRVSTRLKSGFNVVSPVSHFEFGFLAPKQTSPADGATVPVNTKRTPIPDVFFTWQKTNFTVSYDLEVAKDPQFKIFVLKKNVPSNFGALKEPADGTYYWRVRSHSTDVASPYSAAQSFTVTHKDLEPKQGESVKQLLSP
jgi:hypothetical protein